MRKIIVSLFVLCLILIIDSAAAVPASPYPFTLEQPDGYSFQARQFGDERLHWIETLDGYTIVKDENRWWTYAAKNNEGELIPTGNRVGTVTLLSLVFEKHIAPVWKPDNVSITKSSPRQINIKGFDSNVHRAPKASSVTTEKAVVILINFTDVSQQLGHTKPYYDNLIFNNTTGANSMFNYYREVSYNQLNVTGTSGSNWYQSSHTMAYYGADSTLNSDDYNTYIFNLTREAVQLADNDIDFSQYDTDSDGVVDHVIIIHAGYAQESSGISNDIWSHKWSILNFYSGDWHEDGELTNDGVRVIQYTMLAEGSPLGIFAHEFGHDIGLPDLYNTGSGNGVVWDWDLMDRGTWNNNGNSPAHPSIWCKTLLGWVTPTVITLPSTQSILQIETNSVNSAYKISSTTMSENEYFLVENRQLTGYDAWLPEAGILIWHINESQGTISNNDINNYAVKRVIPEDASNGAIAYLGGAAYSSDDGQFAFNATTTPNSNKNDGNPSGIKIYNIGTEGSSMGVTYFNTAPSVSVTYPNGDEAISGNMTITWAHTDIDSIDTHNFTIMLSSDAGITYPTIIISGLSDFVSSYVYNTTSLTDGSNYKIKVIATDNYIMPLSGNDSSNGVFIIENTPPVLIGNPTGYPAGQTASKNGSQITLNATIIEYGAGVKNATVNASQINASLMTNLLLEKVNDYWINQSVIVNAVDGVYYLPVTAYDNASNSNTSLVILAIVDNTPPIVIANPTEYPGGFTAAKNGSTIIINASIIDTLAGIKNATINVSQINSSLGDILLVSSSGHWINDSILVEAPNGNYFLNITAYDNASNCNDSAQVMVMVMVDNTPPTVTGNTPTGTDVPVMTVITLTFDESMNTTSVESAFSTIPSVTGTFIWSGDTMTFTPSADLAHSTTYEVTIGTGAEDLADNPLATAYIWDFTAAAEPDNTPPTVTGNTPTGTDVPVMTVITLTFDESMNTTSVESAFSTIPSVTGTFIWSGDTMTFTPFADLAHSTTYEVTIGTGAEDLADNPLATAYIWDFTTAAEPDNTPPTVTGNTPTGTDVPVMTVITLTFDESMNTTSVESAFSTIPSVTGTFIWSGDTMTFTPFADLAHSTTYEVTIGTGAEDLADYPLATAYIWDFTTAAEPDNTPPTVTGNTPTGTDVPVMTVITLTFDESMNTASVESAFLTIPSVTGTSIWSGDTMTFTPFADLAHSTTYEVTIGTGAEDLAVNPLATAYIWDFTTRPEPDTTHTTIITNANNSTFINASAVNVTLKLFTNDSITGTINITRSKVNITDELEVPGAGIHIRINASTNFSNDNYSNLSWAKIKVYYTYEDVSDNNLVESTLRLYWYNESSGNWVKLVTNSPPWVYGSGVDTANNSVWANVSHFSDYAVGGELQEETLPPSNDVSSSGGGGGGGGTSGEDFNNIVLSETDRQSVFKNSRISYRFELEGNVVKHINFTALNSAGTVAAKVEILNNTSTLVSTLPPDEVYKNLNIWVGNYGWATEKNIDDATVVFTAEKSWINENNIDETTISLYRYSDSNWDKLVTRKVTEDSNRLYFEAETLGFSPFAVSGKKTMGEPGGEGIIEPTVTAEKTPTPTEKKGIPGFSIFAGLSILLIAVQLFHKKN